MKRRDFVSMLIGASTASILVPKRVFSLPPRDFRTADMVVKNYFTSPGPWSNLYATPVDLSEEAIERICIEIRTLTDDQTAKLFLRPTRYLA